jgi:hypothetical protein
MTTARFTDLTMRFVVAIAVIIAGVAFTSCGADDGELIARDAAALHPNPTSGAIFTTLVDGSRVNHNIYEYKEDVYLDGGPGPNAPASAAGLDEGFYYFQVTDPSGKDLLSSDHISCRMIHIDENGVIDRVEAGTNYVKDKGPMPWIDEPCQHATGVDLDQAALGAITVQLYPYDDTPNNGGVYKVWVTPVEEYMGDPGFMPVDRKDAVNGELWQPGNVHGFIPAHSKTDNFKVMKKGKPCDPSTLTVRKFHDANANGFMDVAETFVEGWTVAVTDPLGTGNTLHTPETVIANPAGTWSLLEAVPAGTTQTAAFVDGFPVATEPLVAVTFAKECFEHHEVLYGNIAVGEIEACKTYDRDADGVPAETEPPVAGWMMSLTGTDVTGAVIGPLDAFTGTDGCTTFDGLLPGTYTVEEIMPTTGGWFATGDLTKTFEIASTLNGAEALLVATSGEAEFTNVCTTFADFDTKGYWHNKNGLSELTAADVAFVNGLAPYATPSTYFGAGDEPFDGEFTDHTLVAQVNGAWGELIAPEGSAEAEISHFLVDANATGDPQEQLAQQLLAFIFNTQHRLGDPSAAIDTGSGFVSAATIIGDAISVYLGGTAAEQNAMAAMLDAFNNDDALPVVSWEPCPVVYP